MSRNLARILKTDSLKPLAQILRSKGRKGDTILAHISPKEAARLKRDGGSGTINPDTGLPEFFDGEDFFGGFGDTSSFAATPAPAQTFEAPVSSAMIYDQPAGPVQPAYSGYQQSGDTSLVNVPQNTYDTILTGSRYDTGYSPQTAMTEAFQNQALSPVGSATIYNQAIGPDIANIAAAAGGGVGGGAGTQPTSIEAPGVSTKAADTSEKGLFGDLISNKNALGLGILGAGGLMGYMNQQKAADQAKKAAAQIQSAYAAAAQQQKDLAAPLIGPGYTQLSQALQGTLSPANQQAMQAAQARVAQESARSGGVGAVQSALQEEAFRQQLLTQQQQQALALLAPGNAMIQAAINAQLQGTTQGLSTRLGLEQSANNAAMGLYAALGGAIGGGLIKA